MIHTLDLNFQQIEEVIAAFLIETSEGLVLVESGPHTTYKNLENEIIKVGCKVDDIKHVLLTHIHLDHAGAAWALAEKGAEVHVHPVGYPHLANPTKLITSAKRIYLDDMERLWGEIHSIPENKLHAVVDNTKLEIGGKQFIAHYTPGHAIHHIAWQLDNVLFTGDVAGVKIGNSIVVPPCPPPDIHIEDWQHSISKIRAMKVDTLYLTHFGLVTDKLKHLAQLEEMLLSWAFWIKPYFEREEHIQDVIPKFQDFVKDQLSSFGLDEIGIKKYEAANPSFMSVAGLMRYWKKNNKN
ncbi:MAG: MBL fold metallo-hydrolase [Bacteroidota bacterium]